MFYCRFCSMKRARLFVAASCAVLCSFSNEADVYASSPFVCLHLSCNALLRRSRMVAQRTSDSVFCSPSRSKDDSHSSAMSVSGCEQ